MTEETFEAICNDLETSWEGISLLCKKHNEASSNFYLYKEKNHEALERYARARDKQLNYLEELLLEISMNETRDKIVDGTVNVGSNSIARDRLKVDTLKFILSKLRSNVWGAKVEHTIKSEPRVFKID